MLLIFNIQLHNTSIERVPNYMPKSIIISIDDFYYGGVETSLINMTNLLVDFYQITLIIHGNISAHSLNSLSKNIEITNGTKGSKSHFNILRGKAMQNMFYKNFIRLLKKLGLIDTFYHFLSFRLKDIKCDLAISFVGSPSYSDYFVKYRIDAMRKIAWIHNDPYRLGLEGSNLFKIYKSFDFIVASSMDSVKKIESIDNNVRDKIRLIHNIIDHNKLYELSLKNPVNLDSAFFNILSISRIQNLQKKTSRIVFAAKELVESGYNNFRWYLVGDGPDTESIEKLIFDEGLKDIVILVGKSDNPYSYYINADLFVITSDFEGLPVTLFEAMIFNLPIVSTNYDSVYELIQDGVNGKIVDKSSHDIAIAIKSFIDIPSTLDFIRFNINILPTLDSYKNEMLLFINESLNSKNILSN